jgi:ABC-type glycerol-3-phosphate transport system permease component
MILLGIALFKNPYHIECGPLMAATVISTALILIAYLLSQKYVIRGIVLSGLKGLGRKKAGENLPAFEVFKLF